MNDNFIKKLETDNFILGSFDAFQDNSQELIKNNSNLSEEESIKIMQSIPTAYRASITDKDGNFIGYIGIYNIQAQAQSASIRFEVNRHLSEELTEEILIEYKNWLSHSLNINNIEEYIYCSKEKKEIKKINIEPKPNIIIPSKFLVPGISQDVLEKYSKDYIIPKLQMPYTIKSSDRAIGIIGLSSLIWSNKRANLNLFLDKSLGDDIVKELSGHIIDEYLDYVHSANIHNVTLSVSGSDENMMNILNNTNMNFYAQIPFASISGDNIESNNMYQHIPNMKKQNGIYIPENKFLNVSSFATEKKDLDTIIELFDGYRLVSPKIFEEKNIDINKVTNGHIKAMQNREKFTIPLGEDKYILQKGNGNYGISKALANYSYVLLDKLNNYCGYINILRTNANNKNAEIEVGIDPKLQGKGLGTVVVNKFYDELFSIGYASVTSAVFEFNNPSIKLHEKVAQLNGVRLESYYINGKLWDMNLYSKTNDITVNQIRGK